MRAGSNSTRGAAPLLFLALAGCAGAAAGAGAATGPTAVAAPAPGATAAGITPADLRLRVGLLAHDSLRGRRTGTPGIATASRYLVAEAQRLGLRPAGENGTYLQRVPLVRRSVRFEAGARTPRGEVPLTRRELALISGVAGLPGRPRPAGEGPLVYGGYMVDPAVRADRELKPQQLSGAVLLIRFGAPEGVNPETTPPRLPLATLMGPGSPVSAILLVVEGPALEEIWEFAKGSDQTMRLAAAQAAEGPGGGPPVFMVSAAAAERLLGAPLAGARDPRAGLGTLRYAVREQEERIEGHNVLAVLPGSDRARAGQYVSVGAHYDHVGVGDPVNGDSIFNGADDDASGTSAVLEIAEHFAHLPAAQRPARSLLFVWHTAEEEGLLGSEWLTDHPTFARDSVVAQLNIDMIARNHPDSVFVVGSRRASTALGTTVDAVNQRLARPMGLDYTLDAPGHPEQIYCRSDHYNYARYGIPVAFFTTGLHPDYHKPSDEPETLDYDKLARVSAFIGEVAGAVAAAPTRPTVDRPVPPPGAPCVQ